MAYPVFSGSVLPTDVTQAPNEAVILEITVNSLPEGTDSSPCILLVALRVEFWDDNYGYYAGIKPNKKNSIIFTITYEAPPNFDCQGPNPYGQIVKETMATYNCINGEHVLFDVTSP